MLNQTSIKINGQKYNLALKNITRGEDALTLNLGFYAELHKGSIFAGAVNILVSATLRSSWAKNKDENDDNLNWLRDLLVVTLPYINIEIDEQQIKNDEGLLSFRIMFVSDRNQIDGRTVFIKSEWEAEKQVEKLVYDNEVDDEKVESKILEYLEGCWKQNSQPIMVTDLIRALYIDSKIIERSLHLLEANKYVIINQYSGSIINGKIIIRTDGIRKLRDMRKPEISTPVNTYNISGDLVQGSKSVNTTYGQGSHIIQDSQDIKIINENIDKLLQQLESDYKQEDKNEVMDKVRNVKDMLEAGSRVSEIIGKAIELFPRIKNYAAASLILLKILGKFYLTPAS